MLDSIEQQGKSDDCSRGLCFWAEGPIICDADRRYRQSQKSLGVEKSAFLTKFFTHEFEVNFLELFERTVFLKIVDDQERRKKKSEKRCVQHVRIFFTRRYFLVQAAFT